jgi:hypothetical protein
MLASVAAAAISLLLLLLLLLHPVPKTSVCHPRSQRFVLAGFRK